MVNRGDGARQARLNISQTADVLEFSPPWVSRQWSQKEDMKIKENPANEMSQNG